MFFHRDLTYRFEQGQSTLNFARDEVSQELKVEKRNVLSRPSSEPERVPETFPVSNINAACNLIGHYHHEFHDSQFQDLTIFLPLYYPNPFHVMKDTNYESETLRL